MKIVRVDVIDSLMTQWKLLTSSYSFHISLISFTSRYQAYINVNLRVAHIGLNFHMNFFVKKLFFFNKF